MPSVGFLQLQFQLASTASESSSWDMSTLGMFYDTELQSHESRPRPPQMPSSGVSFGSWVARERADVTCVTIEQLGTSGRPTISASAHSGRSLTMPLLEPPCPQRPLVMWLLKTPTCPNVTQRWSQGFV